MELRSWKNKPKAKEEINPGGSRTQVTGKHKVRDLIKGLYPGALVGGGKFHTEKQNPSFEEIPIVNPKDLAELSDMEDYAFENAQEAIRAIEERKAIESAEKVKEVVEEEKKHPSE